MTDTNTDKFASGGGEAEGPSPSKPFFAQIKIAGKYAEFINRESAERRVSRPALLTDYALRGIEAAWAEDTSSDLIGFERRIAGSVLALRSDVEAMQAEVDTLVAMFDTFVKLMLIHLPEPGSDEAAAVQSSALVRYEKFLKTVAASGFDQDRPKALARVAELLQGVGGAG